MGKDAAPPALCKGVSKSIQRRAPRKERLKLSKGEDADRQHLKECKLDPLTCPQCKFARNKAEYLSTCLVDPELPQCGSWIISTGVGNSFRLGCAVCNGTGSGKWANLRWDNIIARGKAGLKEHQAGVHHQRLLKAAKGDKNKLRAKTPSLKSFEEVLRKTWKNEAQGANLFVKGIGRRQKVRRAKWCLAEAYREINQELLAKCEAIALHQDGTKGCILLRFTACGLDLEAFQGMLAFVNLAKLYGGLRVVDVKSGTLHAIKKACTLGRRPPYRKPQKVFLKELFTHITEKTELWNTDAAEDEVLAGKMLQGVRLDPEARERLVAAHGRTLGALPNLLVRNREKAHGARRIKTQLHRHDRFMPGELQLSLEFPHEGSCRGLGALTRSSTQWRNRSCWARPPS